VNAFDDPEVKGLQDRLRYRLERYPILDVDTLSKSIDEPSFDLTLAEIRQRFGAWNHVLKDDPLLRAIDENPFVKTNVVATYGDGLRGVASELQLSAAQ
jgi:hypothetical protein